MPTQDAHDSFDHLPHDLHRVGAHRAPGRTGRGWVAFWWALGATVVLVAVGVFGILSLNNRLDISLPGSPATTTTAPTPTPTATESAVPSEAPTPEATVDPAVNVTVLNGSSSNGVAASAARTLEAAGWDVGATSNANSQDQPTTIIYYAEDSFEGAALGIAESLPGATILLANDFVDSDADLTVVIGNDYVAPPE